VILIHADTIESEMRLAIEGWETEGGAQAREFRAPDQDNVVVEGSSHLHGALPATSERESSWHPQCGIAGINCREREMSA
jgi:hypothetical protein